MKISFLEPARSELEEAVRHYDEQRVGLGAEFASEVQSTLQRIANCPTTWAKISANIRRCRTRRFPYDVLYHIQADAIVIVAMMHHHRKPGYWKKRLAAPDLSDR